MGVTGRLLQNLQLLPFQNNLVIRCVCVCVCVCVCPKILARNSQKIYGNARKRSEAQEKY